MSAGPQLLPVDEAAARTGGWALIRGGRHWLPVAQHPPSPAAGERCWWSPETPPGGGWWPRRGPRETA